MSAAMARIRAAGALARTCRNRSYTCAGSICCVSGT